MLLIDILTICTLPLSLSANRQNCTLLNSNAVIVHCFHTWNIGQQIDVILEPIIDFGPVPVLDLQYIQFPNGRVTANWYGGHVNVYAIRLELQNVTSIENNAFDAEAFRTVDTITLIFQRLTTIEANVFINLPGLYILIMESTVDGTFLIKPDENILIPIRGTLDILEILHFAGTLNSFLGNVRFSQLSELLISNPSDFYYPRILAPQNFSGLLIMEKLNLAACGIEAILDRTFDSIGRTLITLNITENPLKCLTLDLLWAFISSRPHRRTRLNRSLFAMKNLVKCDCEFYDMKNITLISFKYVAFAYENITCIPNAAYSPDTCKGSQNVHPHNWCLDHPNISLYSYFDVRFKRMELETLNISQNQYKHRKYRLWMQSFNDPEVKRKQRCPNSGWLQRSIACVMLSNVTATIDIHNYLNKSELTLFCAMYLVQYRSAWPLHCITIRDYLTEDLVRWTFWISSFACAFCGLAVGILAFCIREFYRNNEQNSQFEECEYHDVECVANNYEFVNKPREENIVIKGSDDDDNASNCYVEYHTINPDIYLDVLS